MGTFRGCKKHQRRPLGFGVAVLVAVDLALVSAPVYRVAFSIPRPGVRPAGEFSHYAESPYLQPSTPEKQSTIAQASEPPTRSPSRSRARIAVKIGWV